MPMTSPKFNKHAILSSKRVVLRRLSATHPHTGTLVGRLCPLNVNECERLDHEIIDFTKAAQ